MAGKVAIMSEASPSGLSLSSESPAASNNENDHQRILEGFALVHIRSSNYRGLGLVPGRFQADPDSAVAKFRFVVHGPGAPSEESSVVVMKDLIYPGPKPALQAANHIYQAHRASMATVVVPPDCFVEGCEDVHFAPPSAAIGARAASPEVWQDPLSSAR